MSTAAAARKRRAPGEVIRENPRKSATQIRGEAAPGKSSPPRQASSGVQGSPVECHGDTGDDQGHGKIVSRQRYG